MNIIDLSHVIREQMPVYPGTEQPTIERICTFEQYGFREARVTMFTHTGTHIDAPGHMMKDGALLDRLDVSRFAGPAALIDCAGRAGAIGAEALKPYEDQIARSDFVILRTDWSRYWGEPAYFADFPYLSEEAARYLSSFALKGLGVDAISIDAHDTKAFPVHKTLLSRGMIAIENLTNLEPLINKAFTLCVLPLRMEDADGSPVRAVALTDLP